MKAPVRKWAAAQVAARSSFQLPPDLPEAQRVILLLEDTGDLAGQRLARALAEKGHRITIITHRSCEPEAQIHMIAVPEREPLWQYLHPHDVVIATEPEHVDGLFHRGLHQVYWVREPAKAGREELTIPDEIWASSAASAEELSHAVGRPVRLVPATPETAPEELREAAHREVGRYTLGPKLSHPRRPPTLSLCMIAKDEERNLARCLTSACGVADEIILVDTGSTDQTMEIARRFGAEVHQLPWPGDFSIARNAALELAKGDWIISLDCDEAFTPAWRTELPRFLARARADAYSLPMLNLDEVGRPASRFDAIRFWRNGRGYRFEGPIHEQVSPSVAARGGTFDEMNLELWHYGYTHEESLRKNRRDRNLSLLLEAVCRDENNAAYWHYLGIEYYSRFEFEKAEPWFWRVVREGKQYQFTGRTHAFLAYMLLRQERTDEAWDLALRGAATDDGKVDSLTILTAIAKAEGDWLLLDDMVRGFGRVGQHYTGSIGDAKMVEQDARAEALWARGEREAALAIWRALAARDRADVVEAGVWATHVYLAHGLGADTLRAWREIPTPAVSAGVVGLLLRLGQYELVARMVASLFERGVDAAEVAFGLTLTGRADDARELFRRRRVQSPEHLLTLHLLLGEEKELAGALAGAPDAWQRLATALTDGTPLPQSLHWLQRELLQLWITWGLWGLVDRMITRYPGGAQAGRAEAAAMMQSVYLYDRALNLALTAPEQPKALEVIGLDAARRGEWEAAATMLVERAMKGPAPVKVYWEGAGALQHLRQGQAAQELLEMGRQARPHSLQLRAGVAR